MPVVTVDRARLADLRKERAKLVEKKRALLQEYVTLTNRESAGEGDDADRTRLDEMEDSIAEHARSIDEHDGRIGRCERALDMEAQEAEDAERAQSQPGTRGYGRNSRNPDERLPARARSRPDHESDPSLVIGGLCRMMAIGQGNVEQARAFALEIFGGERHPVVRALYGVGFDGAVNMETRAMLASIGPSGGFLVPPDYVASMIEVLRPKTVVRDSNPITLEMPRGTMQMPRQNQPATASYSGETTAIPVSQPAVGQVVATYKKLTGLVPITNDLMRYADPAVDAIVRDDLAQVLARREDLAFIRGDGTADSPKGFASYVLAAQQITSNPSYTLSTAAQELGGAPNKLETANVPMDGAVWIMHPRSKNYLLNVQNSNGFYVYREEMTTMGTLLGFPFKTTTQIPINLTVSANSDCSEVYLVAMRQAMLFDSMRLELAVSREGTYTDANGNLVSVFQSDQTLIRAIEEHDFHMRHDEAISRITGVRWSPAIS